MKKINLSAIAVSLALFILVVNAAEEATSEGAVNATIDSSNTMVNPNSAENQNNAGNQNNKGGKAAATSFGVYLQIVG